VNLQIGTALCLKAKYSGFVSMKLTVPTDRQRLGTQPLTSEEQKLFDKCLIVHLVCTLPK
jgi:hypothetical protein